MLSSCIFCLLFYISRSSLCSFIEVYLLRIQIIYYSVLIFALHNVRNYYAFYLSKHCSDRAWGSVVVKALRY